MPPALRDMTIVGHSIIKMIGRIVTSEKNGMKVTRRMKKQKKVRAETENLAEKDELE